MGILDEAMREELVFLDVEAKDKQEAIRVLGSILEQKGYVKPSYISAVLQREEVYPTGLLLESINIAIPHTDSEHVEKSAILLARLAHPVVFQYMGDPKESVSVDFIAMLAIKDPAGQVPVLMELMEKVGTKGRLERMKEAKTPQEMLEALRKEEKE